MDIYIPLALLICIFCFFLRGNHKVVERFFTISIIIVWILMSVRYEFGPDYQNYRNIYEGVRGEGNLEGYTGIGQSVESLFLRFLQLFPSFTSFIVFLTTFWFGVNLYIIKKYIESRYYWVVILYFFFNANYLLSSLVAMRTALCGCLFMVALLFLLRGKRFIYIAIILLASLIHSSTIILVVLVFLNGKNNSLFFKLGFALGFGLIAMISFLMGENVVMGLFAEYMIDNIDSFEHYSSYEFTTLSRSFNTFVFRIMSLTILFYLILSGKKETESTYIIMYKIGIVAALFLLIFGQNMISDRFLLILNPIFIVSLTRSIGKNMDSINVLIFVFLMVISIYIFYNKMIQEYSESFLKYQSVFSAPYIP